MFEFKDFDHLTDGEIDLRIKQKRPANEEKQFVPTYIYDITLHGKDEAIGKIDIRIGYNEKLYYGGQIGYGVDEAYRGNSYAAKACKIIMQVAAAHDMDKIIITYSPDNIASRRTCEKAGLVLKEIVELPEHNEMYKEGAREKCIYQEDFTK